MCVLSITKNVSSEVCGIWIHSMAEAHCPALTDEDACFNAKPVLIDWVLLPPSQQQSPLRQQPQVISVCDGGPHSP